MTGHRTNFIAAKKQSDSKKMPSKTAKPAWWDHPVCSRFSRAPIIASKAPISTAARVLSNSKAASKAVA